METSWRKLWGAAEVRSLDHDFVETESGLLHKNGSTLEEYSVPIKSARKAAEAAFEEGAVAFKRWPLLWGLSLGLSVPGMSTAWIVAHDYDTGKFVSAGIKFIEGIPFADNMTVYEEQYARAARYVLGYGVRRKTEGVIKDTLRVPFYVTPKVVRMWGPDVARLRGTNTAQALQKLQADTELSPELAFKNSKTLEIVHEQHQQATYKNPS